MISLLLRFCLLGLLCLVGKFGVLCVTCCCLFVTSYVVALCIC